MAARTVALLAAMALILAACGGGDSEGSATTAAPTGPAAAGMAVFEGNCAVCHGDDLSGKVGPALGAGSSISTQPDDALRRQIREGGNGMPGWDGLISDDEIEAVIAFIRSVQQGD